MEYRQLSRSGPRVSTFTLGTMGFGGTGWASVIGQIGVDGAREQLDVAREAGVNLVDTADVYSDGASEEILGQALGATRDEWLIRPGRGWRWVQDRTTPASRGTTSCALSR